MMKLLQFCVTTFLVRDVCWISTAFFGDMQIFCSFLLFFYKPSYLHGMEIDTERWFIQKLC